MGTILKGMGRVRWRELTHAYGTAEEVPGRLSRVAWGDEPTSADALADLGLWLGELAVFDATAATVPFLWDLAVTRSVPTRPDVLALLHTILDHGNAARPDHQQSAHAAVLAGASLAGRLAEDDDPDVRAAAASLSAALAGHTCETCRPT
ncbi:hypothetical protein [Streptomyces sp. NPDC097619]|uniref:hypothetical protein n=1 Tax=Streptomyces sp. NPDC097619 TaxID=3157228 RepID=UPI00331E329F